MIIPHKSDFAYLASAFDSSGYHTVYDLLVEKQEENQHRDSDYQYICKQQVIRTGVSAHKVIKSKLNCYIIISRKEVQRVSKIVENCYRIQDDNCGCNRFQKRENNLYKQIASCTSVDVILPPQALQELYS